MVGAIGPGLCVLVGVTHDDTEASAKRLADKLWNLRIMADAEGVMNLSIADTTRSLLVVSQFTLYASTKKGSRPSWSGAAPPDIAQPKFDALVAALAAAVGRPVATGVFGADMQVALVNDGPVTIWLDSRARE